MPKLVRESETFPARGAIAPHKIVLREMDNGAYATHWYNVTDDAYYHGHYFDPANASNEEDLITFAEAFTDFNQRVELSRITRY